MKRKIKKLSLDELSESFSLFEKEELICIKGGSGGTPDPGGYIFGTPEISVTILTGNTSTSQFGDLLCEIQAGNLDKIQPGTYTAYGSYKFTIDSTQYTNPVLKTLYKKSTFHIEAEDFGTGIWASDPINGDHIDSFFRCVQELSNKLGKTPIIAGYISEFAFNYDYGQAFYGVVNPLTDSMLSNATERSFLQDNFNVSTTPMDSIDKIEAFANNGYYIVTNFLNNGSGIEGRNIIITSVNGSTGQCTYDDPTTSQYGLTASLSNFNTTNATAVKYN